MFCAILIFVGGRKWYRRNAIDVLDLHPPYMKLEINVESGGIGPAPIAYHCHALVYMSRM
jgi:hypothetical protein